MICVHCSFAANSSDLEMFLEGKTLDEAFETKKLFIVNHKILDGLSDVHNDIKVSQMIIIIQV